MSEYVNQEALLSSLKTGDANAVSFVVKTELPRVYNLCLRLCRNSAEAEDLAQDVFVRALKGFSNFDGRSQISTWLYTVTVNTWKNKIRSESRHMRSAHIPLDSPVDSEEEKLSPLMSLREKEPTPDQVLETKELSGSIYMALDQMDSEDRSIIILRDVEQLSYEEISSILKLNLGTVKSKLSRAREMLRQKWRMFR